MKPGLAVPVLALALLPVAWTAPAQTLAASPDVHLDLAGNTLSPAAVVEDIAATPPVGIPLGPLPDGAEVVAYAPFPGTGELFVLEHTMELPGGVVARPFDIVLWDGASHSIALPGTGIFPDGVAIDAIGFVPAGSQIWISLDSAAEVGGGVFRASDVFDGTLALVFDSGAAGVPDGLDLDAISPVEGSSELLLSFDAGGSVGGLTFADEDVLRYDPVGAIWSFQLDTSSLDPAWQGADLGALHLVPEPGLGAGLLWGCALLACIGRKRNGGSIARSSKETRR